MPEPITTQGETPAKPTEPVVPVEQPPASNVQQPASEQTEEPFDKDRAMNTIKNLREVEKQAKQERKELETLRAEKKQRDEAEMTELQKLQKQNEELQASNAKIQADMWRTEAATAANLPSIFAERIQGKTKDEMLEDAEKLAEALPKTTKTQPKINATNPAKANQTESDAQKRERLFGKQGSNLFDVEEIKKRGGGVIFGN